MQSVVPLLTLVKLPIRYFAELQFDTWKLRSPEFSVSQLTEISLCRALLHLHMMSKPLPNWMNGKDS
jgi:hypothetical protein